MSLAYAVALDHEQPGDAVRAHTLRIAASATRRRRRELPMLFTNLTIRLLGSDDFP